MRALVLLAACASAAVASQPVVPCTYDTCAVRIETGFFSGLTGGEIVAGAPDGSERVIRPVGFLSGGLVDHVADVPAAYDHARTSRGYKVGALVTGLAGGVLYSLAFNRIGNDRLDSGTEATLMLAGAALTISSGFLTLKSQREQSRAVWEYNRAVVAPQE